MLEQLVHTVESGLMALFRPSTREQLQAEVKHLTAELGRHREELNRSRLELAGVKRRLRDDPTSAALLHSRIEKAIHDRATEQAWQLALELDQLRQSLTSDQQVCPRLEQKCWSLQFLVGQLERRLGRIQEQLSSR